MRRYLLLLLLGTWCAGAGAQPAGDKLATTTPAQLLAALPAEAGGFQRGPITDFEARPNGAGLGAGVEYRPATGSGVANAYIYNRGRRDLRDGLGPDDEAELAAALRDVQALAPMRQYRIAAQRQEVTVPDPRGRPALRCAVLDLEFEGGRHSDSLACTGVLRGFFLKLRLTLPAGPPGAAEARLQDFARPLVAALGR